MADIQHSGPPAGIRLKDKQTDADSDIRVQRLDSDEESIPSEPEDLEEDETELSEEEFAPQDDEQEEIGSESTVGEGEGAAEDASPSAVPPPEYLPQGIDWNALDDQAKLLVQHAYERGRSTESASISDEEKAVLTQYRRLSERVGPEPDSSTPPELKAPVIDLPDEYKDDPGLTKVFGGVNQALADQTRLNNALVQKVYQLTHQLKNVAGSGSEMARNMAWAQFISLHPEANDERVHAALSEQLRYVNPNLPEYQQWELALRFSGVKPVTPSGKDQVDDLEDRIRRGRAVRAASAVSTRNVGRRVARTGTPDSELRGKTFEDVWRYEKKNGALPSQGGARR